MDAICGNKIIKVYVCCNLLSYHGFANLPFINHHALL
jgi:hypothetical protein